MSEAQNTICQSCSMPLSRDPEKGGSEVDGSKSTLYCSYCYHQGAFTQPDMKVHEMMSLVEDTFHKMWIPRFIAKQFAKKIPQLKRWSQRQS